MPITDADVAWAATELGLPLRAFSGVDGRDPRGEVLKSLATMDVEACPGSGKTTLLVAKLAILARTWRWRTRGICVLSHTNVARDQIELHLGNGGPGEALVRYPHYIGTIHGFVNDFLAMPWLRTQGYEVRAIDDTLCERHRRHLLTRRQFSALATHVANKESNGQVNIVGSWRISDASYAIRKANREPVFQDQSTPSAKQLLTLCKQCMIDGYHRYDEMFVWAHELLDKRPEIIAAIRRRFPVLFLDEVQDNSEEQSALLYRVFVEGGTPVCRQRYGDSNQAIYYHAGVTEGAKTDVFPDPARKRDIPTSHRFGEQIARLADPFGVAPQGLKGGGPPVGVVCSDTTGKHAVFLFDDNTLPHVLPAYATYLAEVFAAEELRCGTFTAVGAVHRPGEDKDRPRSVGSYWSRYDADISVQEPRPDTFLQYLSAGRRAAASSGDTAPIVDKVAHGILRLALIADPTSPITIRRRPHRRIVELLRNNVAASTSYAKFLDRYAIRGVPPTEAEWNTKSIPQLHDILRGLGATDETLARCSSFLRWLESTAHENESPADLGNVFLHHSGTAPVRVRVGSIHSVKGETHTATLVFETYFYGHHLLTLKPWLLGPRSGQGNEKARNTARLRLHYVAMTRPTHLLCLAMRADSLSQTEADVLKRRGWRLGAVTDVGTRWL